jgi:hypothetical protein
VGRLASHARCAVQCFHARQGSPQNQSALTNTNPVNRRRPPMCFSIEDADFLVDVMDQALSEL